MKGEGGEGAKQGEGPSLEVEQSLAHKGCLGGHRRAPSDRAIGHHDRYVHHMLDHTPQLTDVLQHN